MTSIAFRFRYNVEPDRNNASNMILLFGWEKKGATVRPLIDTHCYECKRTTTFDWYRVTEYLSAFFVPLLPLTRDHFLVCQSCRDGLQLQKTELLGIKRLRQLPEAESRRLHDRLVQRLEDHQLSGKTETQREYLKTGRDSN